MGACIAFSSSLFIGSPFVHDFARYPYGWPMDQGNEHQREKKQCLTDPAMWSST
jgi:hypothetical protein